MADVARVEGGSVGRQALRRHVFAQPEDKPAALAQNDSVDIAKLPFAETVKASILNADITHPTMDPVPYTGIQYVAIPEFQAMGTQVGQLVASALAGQSTVDAALKQAQESVTSTMEQAGYK